MIIYIDRRQYLCSSEEEQRIARLLQAEREYFRTGRHHMHELGRRGSTPELIYSLRKQRHLRTDFFRSRMFAYSVAVVRRVEQLVSR